MPTPSQVQVLESSTNDSSCTFLVSFPEDLPYFEGHFESFPVLPGVALLKTTVELTPRHLFDKDVYEVKSLKFTDFIRPGMELWVTYKKHKSGGVDFSWKSGECSYASGRLCG